MKSVHFFLPVYFKESNRLASLFKKHLENKRTENMAFKNIPLSMATACSEDWSVREQYFPREIRLPRAIQDLLQLLYL
jgi:hypothetical protein